jgi:alpha-tubulin suppressor-like RCC1 family protein
MKHMPWCPLRSITMGLLLLQCSATALAQSYASVPIVPHDEDPTAFVVQWGQYAYDTRARELPLLQVVCGDYNTGLLRRDGRLFVQGANGALQLGLSMHSQVPPLPTGMTYTDVSLSGAMGLAVRSDGNIIGWAGMVGPPLAAPTPPAGVRYLRVSNSGPHALALRSDGQLVAFGSNQSGQCSMPSWSGSATVVDFQAGGNRSAILLSDGRVLLFGDNNYGQSVAPPLPPGITYVAMAARRLDFTLLLRSDGLIEAFGNNQWGQLNVPALPPGQTYQRIAAGSLYGVALRSDNQFVVWGPPTLTSPSQGFGLGLPPTIPAGLQVVALDAVHNHVVALLSDGSMLSWGHNGFYEHFVPDREPDGRGIRRSIDQTASGLEVSAFLFSDGTVEAFGLNNVGQCDVPPLPLGMRYTKVGVGGLHTVLLRSDGNAIAIGYNGYGALNVPALPSGVTYTDLSVEHGHSVLLRSDGQAVAFGDNPYGQCNVPALPPGLRYVKADANFNNSLLLRSDGSLAHCGVTQWGQGNLPVAQPGNPFVDIATTHFFSVALAEDNSVAVWGGAGGSYWTPLPTLPSGVYYVEVAGGANMVGFRRSDGRIDVLGNFNWNVTHVPALDPGTSYVQVAGKHLSLAARGSSTCTYVGFAPGCAGSLPAAKLIPRDTPRIGRTLAVSVRNLPVDIAAMAMSFQPPTGPISLAAIGMPGCELRIQVDGVGLIAGQRNSATFELPIPNVRSLVGVRFYHQALVLDPMAGNGLGAVISEASEGIVGYP